MSGKKTIFIVWCKRTHRVTKAAAPEGTAAKLRYIHFGKAFSPPDSQTACPAAATERNEKLQLSEILDGANHLRSVGVLVVIPRNNLNLIQTVGDLSYHSLSSVEQRAESHTDNVG